MKHFEVALNNYINHPEDPEYNRDLANAYFGIGQTASAVSFYLRAAERMKHPLDIYGCLLKASECFHAQGSRNLSVRAMLQHAITLMPNLPHAYYSLSQILEQQGDYKGRWFESHMIASLGFEAAKEFEKNKYEIYNVSSYPGIHAMLLQKAHTAWHCGLCDDSRDMFIDLKTNYQLDEYWENLVNINLEFLGVSDIDAEFDWGLIKNNNEVFEQDVYQKFRKVEKNDVVVDVGASVGPFTYKIVNQTTNNIYCLEPHEELFKTLQKNVGDNPRIRCINKAISSETGQDWIERLFDEHAIDTHAGANALVETIGWEDFIEENDIKRIDFLKVDCEGGEYEIFTKENLPWIKHNVGYIVGEWHLSKAHLEFDFRRFRDLYLKEFPNHKVYSFDGVDITHDLWTDWFIDHYDPVTIYIDNEQKPEGTEKWKNSIAPTMEITTVIPEKGCTVDCVFCPQETLKLNYKDTRRLTFDKFKQALDKIPTDVRITFAGFTEPWLNSDCTKMLLEAHRRGHPVSVFTTLVGMSKDDLRAIKDIPFAGNPNGGFTVHLPDQDMRAKHPINKKYIETVEYLGEIQDEIQNFNIMCMGTVHEKVKHVFSEAPTYDMWSRAGNLIGEANLKPELKNEFFKYIDHGDKDMTCGCEEHLYHNILLPNGDVSLCCMDYGMDEILGNLFTQEYNDIMPEPQTTFELCKQCENAVCPVKGFNNV